MTCGRPKNLEIAGRNPLSARANWRRTSPTTGNGSRRRGNPEPPAKGGNPRSHRRRELSESPVRGQPRATADERTPRHPAQGATPGPPGTGGNSWATRQRAVLRLWRRTAPSHPATGNSALRCGRAWSHRQGGFLSHTGDPGNRNTGKATGPGRRSSGATDAEKSAGRRRETGRGPSISYMEGPRPIVPDLPNSRPDRHAAPWPRQPPPGPPAAARSTGLTHRRAAGDQFARLPHGGDQRDTGPVRQVRV
jgi:hypothetical protein